MKTNGKLKNCAHESLQSNIKIITSSSKGRCAIWNSTDNISAGEAILSVLPISWKVTGDEENRKNHCSLCFRKVSPLFQCGKCKEVRYCGSACQKYDWKHGHHKLECKQFTRLMGSRRDGACLLAKTFSYFNSIQGQECHELSTQESLLNNIDTTYHELPNPIRCGKTHFDSLDEGPLIDDVKWKLVAVNVANVLNSNNNKEKNKGSSSNNNSSSSTSNSSNSSSSSSRSNSNHSSSRLVGWLDGFPTLDSYKGDQT